MFHHSVSTYSLGRLLSASSLSTSTHAWTHSHVHFQTLLSSTWSSWAVLSQSREPDYPLALNFILFHSHLGGGWVQHRGHQDFPLVIKAHFIHISRIDGQLFLQHNRHYLGYFLQQNRNHSFYQSNKIINHNTPWSLNFFQLAIIISINNNINMNKKHPLHLQSLKVLSWSCCFPVLCLSTFPLFCSCFY